MPQAVYTCPEFMSWVFVSIRNPTSWVALLLTLLTARILSAGQVSETWTFLTPVAVGNCQSFQGPAAQETATIGVVGGTAQPGEPLRVIEVAPASPASIAGIQAGDSLWGIDAGDGPVAIDSCELLRREVSSTRDLVLLQPADRAARTDPNSHPPEAPS